MEHYRQEAAVPVVSYFFGSTILIASPALAWDGQGHELTGSIADPLLAGTRADDQVRQILGYGLREAAT